MKPTRLILAAALATLLGCAGDPSGPKQPEEQPKPGNPGPGTDMVARMPAAPSTVVN